MFLAVVKPIVFRVLFVIEAYYNLDIDQIDVETIFLFKIINKLVYI